jgi:hypothetical protein
MALFGMGGRSNAGTANRPKHSAATHGILWPLLLLTLAAYVVETAGIASLQHSCNETDYAGIDWMQLPTGLGCRRVFSYMWFIYFFNFFVWLYLAISLITSTLHYTYVPITAMLAIACVLHMWATNVFYNVRDAYSTVGGKNLTRAKVAFAGYMAKAICDGLLILALGPAGHKEVVRRYNLVGGDPVGHGDPRYEETGGLRPTGQHYGTKKPGDARTNIATPADGAAIV